MERGLIKRPLICHQVAIPPKDNKGKMGGETSKHAKQPKTFVLPVDQVPYQGPSLQYVFRNITTKMKAHFGFTFAEGQNVVTSNIDEYYPHLAESYNDGFKLVQFLRIPFTQSHAGMISMSVKVPYQAVYCKKYVEQPQTNSWQLKIEKSLIYMHRLGGGMLFSLRQGFAPPTSDLTHMYDIIQRNAAAGGRFVCMEQTGMVQSQGMNMAMSGVSPGRCSLLSDQTVLFWHQPK